MTSIKQGLLTFLQGELSVARSNYLKAKNDSSSASLKVYEEMFLASVQHFELLVKIVNDWKEP